jgi:hypothetical protein
LAEVTTDAAARIASLEAKVRFYERKLLESAIGEQNEEH